MGIGGVGVSSETAPPSDLDTIYLGGEFFLDRMKAMGQQTAAAKKALSDLALGQEAVAANVAAKSALADAQKVKDAAAKALADATAKAKEIVDAANAKAADIGKAAQDAANKLNADAVGARNAADNYATKTKADADAALADVKSNLAVAAQQSNAVKKAQSDALAAKKASDAATKAAQDMLKTYQGKVAKLQSVISDN